MTTTSIRITYGDDVCTMTWDGVQASAPILLDGVSTGYQTADARHRVGEAVRLVAGRQWGTVYDTQEDADEADPTADPSTYCVWDEVGYEEQSVTLDELVASVEAEIGSNRVRGAQGNELRQICKQAIRDGQGSVREVIEIIEQAEADFADDR